MSDKDHFTDTLKRREKAEEDRYFAERDRELRERLRRQRESPPAESDGEHPGSQYPPLKKGG